MPHLDTVESFEANEVKSLISSSQHTESKTFSLLIIFNNCGDSNANYSVFKIQYLRALITVATPTRAGRDKNNRQW